MSVCIWSLSIYNTKPWWGWSDVSHCDTIETGAEPLSDPLEMKPIVRGYTRVEATVAANGSKRIWSRATSKHPLLNKICHSTAQAGYTITSQGYQNHTQVQVWCGNLHPWHDRIPSDSSLGDKMIQDLFEAWSSLSTFRCLKYTLLRLEQGQPVTFETKAARVPIKVGTCWWCTIIIGDKIGGSCKYRGIHDIALIK